ncbi:hypothetical protein CDO73_05740 [Saccharibacillus sp. O23]|uniref:hypothetical protein n=1 Tax=Saccharibacillus sp. O23 TaxID=2009338 RepID=UPI000B4E4316|nr:hypothetical protein [Saccharibacillus sp. O23]OWR31974.1 hypothetical protein CDO73_05740 [Saccharibacillus sp. O23]
MNEPNIKERLKPRNSDAVPEIVEERLNETFRQIRLEAAAREKGDLPAALVGGPARSGRPKRTVRFTAFGTAVLLLIGLALAGLSLLSPTFAQTLQRFSALGTMYSDKGMEAAERKGLIQSYPSDLESNEVPFGVRGIIYDGTRVVFDLYRKKSESGNRVSDVGNLRRLSLSYKGEELSGFYSPVNDDTNVVTFDRIDEIDPPEQFELTLHIYTTNSEIPYEVGLPVELNTSNIVIEKPEMPAELKDCGITVDKIILTPITTQVVYHSPFTLEWSGCELRSVIDERGVETFVIGGYRDPLPGNKQFLTSYAFEPTQEGDQEVTLRFNVTKESKRLRTIDMTVPIPAADLSSPSE